MNSSHDRRQVAKDPDSADFPFQVFSASTATVLRRMMPSTEQTRPRVSPSFT